MQMRRRKRWQPLAGHLNTSCWGAGQINPKKTTDKGMRPVPPAHLVLLLQPPPAGLMSLAAFRL